MRQSDAEEADITVAEIELALRVRQLSLDVVSGDDAAETLERLYDYARTGPRPLLLLSIGNSAKLNQACLSISAIGRIPYFDVGSGSFPMALGDNQGNLQVFYTRYDLIDDIVGQLENGATIFQSHHAQDSGWSRLWRTRKSGGIQRSG